MNPDVIVLALERDHFVGIGPFVTGIGVVLILLGAFAFGQWRRRREPPPPSPEEQPHGPDTPVEYETEIREADEIPRDGHRRLPYELHVSGTRTSARKKPPRWRPGHSGSFGNG